MQIILTQAADGTWGYVILTDGTPTGLDGGYDSPQDALADAMACPTPR